MIFAGEHDTAGPADGDEVDGGGGNDIIFGSRGNDTIDGGTGTDTILAGAGNDIIKNGDGISGQTGLIYGGEGKDTADFSDVSGQAFTAHIEKSSATVPQDGVSVASATGSWNTSVYETEIVKFGDQDDHANLTDADPDIELTLDMGAGNNQVGFAAAGGPGEGVPTNEHVLRVNFSTTKVDGSEAGVTTNTIVIDAAADDYARTTPVLTVDGKQLVGGAAFDFDKFDRYGGVSSVWSGVMNLPGMPWVTGNVSTTDRIGEWLGEHIDAFTAYLGGLTGAAGAGTPMAGGVGSLISASLMPLLYADLVRLKDSWNDYYHQEIIGTQGERYSLSNPTYNIANRVASADLTITINFGQPDAYQIKIIGWKQNDFGIRIENLDWREGLD